MTRLEEQIEGFETDVEALAGGEGRRAGAGGLPRRQEGLEALIARHRQHIVRLEQVLRLMENDQARIPGPCCCITLRCMILTVDAQFCFHKFDWAEAHCRIAKYHPN